ncbi:hypothetical protein J6590_009743 [Homalodisca vitripennis]|nr:hypothetical protein J6590_009743 [Homalodisca vitripennis]
MGPLSGPRVGRVIYGPYRADKGANKPLNNVIDVQRGGDGGDGELERSFSAIFSWTPQSFGLIVRSDERHGSRLCTRVRGWSSGTLENMRTSRIFWFGVGGRAGRRCVRCPIHQERSPRPLAAKLGTTPLQIERTPNRDRTGSGVLRPLHVLNARNPDRHFRDRKSEKKLEYQRKWPRGGGGGRWTAHFPSHRSLNDDCDCQSWRVVIDNRATDSLRANRDPMGHRTLWTLASVTRVLFCLFIFSHYFANKNILFNSRTQYANRPGVTTEGGGGGTSVRFGRHLRLFRSGPQ